MTANSGASTSSAEAAQALSKRLLRAALAPAGSGWSPGGSGGPATGRMVVREPAMSSRAGATNRSVSVFSSSQASSRRRPPSISGQATPATVPAPNRRTAAATPPRPPAMGTSAADALAGVAAIAPSGPAPSGASTRQGGGTAQAGGGAPRPGGGP